MIESGTSRREIPSGTVTFLFSDIEGSTQRWEQHRAAMADAVRRHDAIMRSAIESHDGYVFKTIGDAFCAAFANAHAAIAAAYEAQRAIAADEWLSVDGLRVRMALHTGSTDERDGDYFGPAVNRVARLLAVAHGGQVITSGVSADLLQGQMPPQTSLRDLGAHRLKDLTFPEQVYQLISPDLRSDFPPLRSLDTFPNNLPRTVTSFVGRDDDVREIKALVGKSDLVTLVGTGGVGKTRTALHVAADLLDNTADGAWFVEFAPIAEPSLVASTIGAAIGASGSTDRAPLDVLIGYLKDRQLLLLMDNCEHVVSEAARVADAIVRGCRRVKIIATSREGLNVAGEHVYRMPSMTLPARGERVTAAQGGTYGAVALFVERAAAADGRFMLTDENVNAVVDICRRLDGIALAIELAAPRVKVLSVQQLAQRLDERFRILTGGSRTALPRQQTMRALIDWSFDLLTDQEKLLFRRLAVFSGGWTIEAASEICADEALESWDVLDLLSSLVDKSLVTTELADSHQRYRLLESMRQYARERLAASGDAAALPRRHAEYYGAIAVNAYESWSGVAEREWLAPLAVEIDNFRNALTWSLTEGNDVPTGCAMASTLFRVFDRAATVEEALRWSTVAIDSAQAADIDTTIVARLHYARAFSLFNSSRNRQALVAAREAVELFRQADSPLELTVALMQLSNVLAIEFQYAEAREVGEEAVSRARAMSDKPLTARTLQYLAASYDPSEIATARELFREAVGIFRSAGRDSELGNALVWWSDIESAAGNFDVAIKLAKESLTVSRPTDRLINMANLCAFELCSGRIDLALDWGRQVIPLVIEAQRNSLIAFVIQFLGLIAAEQGDIQMAARLLGYADMRLEALEAQRGPTEQVPYDMLVAKLRASLDETELMRLMKEGAIWSAEQAHAEACRI